MVTVPNPIFDKDLQDGEDLEGARRRRDYPEHWIYRAKGGELASPAWYFSGRKKALFEITRWLRLREAGGVCVVTGSAGLENRLFSAGLLPAQTTIPARRLVTSFRF